PPVCCPCLCRASSCPLPSCETMVSRGCDTFRAHRPASCAHAGRPRAGSVAPTPNGREEVLRAGGVTPGEPELGHTRPEPPPDEHALLHTADVHLGLLGAGSREHRQDDTPLSTTRVAPHPVASRPGGGDRE